MQTSQDAILASQKLQPPQNQHPKFKRRSKNKSRKASPWHPKRPSGWLWAASSDSELRVNKTSSASPSHPTYKTQKLEKLQSQNWKLENC